jgi:hypothetical protein
MHISINGLEKVGSRARKKPLQNTNSEWDVTDIVNNIIRKGPCSSNELTGLDKKIADLVEIGEFGSQWHKPIMIECYFHHKDRKAKGYFVYGFGICDDDRNSRFFIELGHSPEHKPYYEIRGSDPL